jgi:ADP-heptose:LPS heptosyltransferase
MYMPISRETRKKMDGVLSGMGVTPKDALVAVHPSSSCESKRWPPERFAAVADRLIDEHGVKIALISGQDGVAHADQMKNSMKHAVLDFSGKVTVSEMASIISRSELFISNDSGPVHVASALGTPVLAIFGRNESGLGPRRWGPTGAEDSIMHKPASCDPCKAHDCDKGFVCLYSIDEDEVIAAASAMLKKRMLLRR